MVSVDGALDDAWKKPKEPNIYKSKKNIYRYTNYLFSEIYMYKYICISIYLSKYQYVLDGCGVQPGKDGICG